MNLEALKWTEIERLDRLGEGGLWDHRNDCYLCVDILAGIVLRISQEGISTRFHLDDSVGWIALYGPLGTKYLCGLRNKIVVVELRHDGTHEIWETLQVPGLPNGVRINDGKVVNGEVIFGTLSLENEADEIGEVYLLRRDRSFERLAHNFNVPNGPAVFSDGGVVINDSLKRLTFLMRMGGAGQKSNLEIWREHQAEEGYPDGMTVDRSDCLWIAHWGGKQIVKYSKRGDILRRCSVPALNPTSIVFGGPSLNDLYVTTANVGISNESASLQNGAVLVVPGLEVRGCPADVFQFES